NWIFFPWVPNGETVDKTGPWYGSVTIQNVENSPIQLTFGPTAGGLSAVTQTAIVNAHAAYTFSAADIFGASSTVAGGGVAATAVWAPNALPSFCNYDVTNNNPTQTLVVQRDDDVQNLPDGTTKTADQDILAALPAGAKILNISGDTAPNTTDTPDNFGAPYPAGPNYKVTNGNEVTWLTTYRPGHNSTYTVTYVNQYCGEKPMPFIAGVEKQTTPSNNGFGVSTSNTNLIVDGYTGVSDADTAWGPNSKACAAIQSGNSGSGLPCNNLGGYFLGLPISQIFNGTDWGFDGHSYLPIVQNAWSGWDTIINVTNVDASTGSYSAVTLTFYNQGQGVGNQAVATQQFSLAGGASKQIDTASIFGNTPFLGSVWITSDFGVVANAVRIKNSTNMAMINTSVPSLLATTSPTNPNLNIHSGFNGEFTMYAPLVYKDYNGWNTGINIANTSELQINQVTVQFFSRDGTSMGTCTTAIPAKGMQYCYIPASQDQALGNGDFGTAVITGNAPFAATVDEVKYSTGDAMSYPVTGATVGHTPNWCQNVPDVDSWRCAHGNMLALPLFQNGHNVGGVEHGDASGINIFNPGSGVASGTVNFYALDGSLQTPSNIGSVPFSVASMSTALLYAPSYAQMTPGIQLTAVVTATSGRIVAVSNNVNYDVTGDGGAVFNLENQFGLYRYVCSQQQCGPQAWFNGFSS
ncbi:MAG TPA: hypothetical protein VKU87_08815, partial [Thermomicrobiaceae bacterium]|nr:hypothetical protein [Thermomicrobiaceae bacterium]